MSQGLLLFSLGLGTVAAILEIVATAIPYWTVGENAHVGLWQACIGFSGSTVCASIESPIPDKLGAARALSIISVIFLAGVLVLVVLKAFVQRESTVLLLFAAILSFVGGALAIGAIGAYASLTSTDLGAAFYLSIVAAVAAKANGILLVIVRRRQW